MGIDHARPRGPAQSPTRRRGAVAGVALVTGHWRRAAGLYRRGGRTDGLVGRTCPATVLAGMRSGRPAIQDQAEIRHRVARNHRRGRAGATGGRLGRCMKTEFWLFGKFETPLIDVRQVADLLRVKPKTVQNRVASGEFPRPRHKTGNRKEFRMTPEAWDIINRQPRTSERVFPYNPKSIGTAFSNTCSVLGIPNLRFHDLRHEATSRLFELGYAIHEVAQFTLHESWATLKRYTHLKPADVPDKPRSSATT